MIYQLRSADLVTGLAFSPACRRFYDLRGCSVNAWEPNSLIRFSELEESTSDAASEDQSQTLISHTSDASLVPYEAVTVVALAPGSSWYCLGNEEGAVDLFHIQQEGPIELFRFLNFLNVSQLAWSQDATHVAAADLGGDIHIKRLIIPAAKAHGTLALESLASPRIDLDGRGIHHMLFNSDSTLLLVASEDRGQIWSLNDKVMIATFHDQDMNRKWLQHPMQKSIFLGFGASDIRVFQWRDFLEQGRLNYQHGRPRLDSVNDHTLNLAQPSLGTDNEHYSNSSVSRILLTQDGRHILIQMKCGSGQGRVIKQSLIFEVSSFEPDRGEDIPSDSLSYAYIPPDIQSRIEIPLGVLTGSRLAFLDQDLWFCTFKLRSTDEPKAALQRHYFIPREWTNTESVEQCCMMENGNLLCPKDDEVAVMKFDLENFGF